MSDSQFGTIVDRYIELEHGRNSEYAKPEERGFVRRFPATVAGHREAKAYAKPRLTVKAEALFGGGGRLRGYTLTEYIEVQLPGAEKTRRLRLREERFDADGKTNHKRKSKRLAAERKAEEAAVAAAA